MEKAQIFKTDCLLEKKRKKKRKICCEHFHWRNYLQIIAITPKNKTLMRFWMKIPIPCAKELKIRMRIIDEQSSE